MKYCSFVLYNYHIKASSLSPIYTWTIAAWDNAQSSGWSFTLTKRFLRVGQAASAVLMLILWHVFETFSLRPCIHGRTSKSTCLPSSFIFFSFSLDLSFIISFTFFLGYPLAMNTFSNNSHALIADEQIFLALCQRHWSIPNLTLG